MSRVVQAAIAVSLWGPPLVSQGIPELAVPTHALGPATVALGGAGVARPHDASGTLNPAAILNAPRISLYHYEGFSDYAGNHAAGSLKLLGTVALAASVRHFGWDRVVEDDIGVPTAGLRTGEALYSLTAAAAPLRAVHVGVAVNRLVSDNLGVRLDGTSWSVGALFAYARGGRAGIALLHAGPRIRGVTAETHTLPTRVRAGLQQDFLKQASFVLDTSWPTHASGAWGGNLGVEWRAPAFLVLRLGVESLEEAGAAARETRLSSGLGLLVGPLEVSLATRFGGVAGSQEWFVGLDAFRAGRAGP